MNHNTKIGKPPRDPELNALANRWLKWELPDDGNELKDEIEERFSFSNGNPPVHVRFFFRGRGISLERFGVYFRFGNSSRQWWVAYCKNYQTAVRLADAFTLHFWYTRVRSETVPDESRFNLSREQAQDDCYHPDVANWLERLEDIFIARGAIPDRFAPKSELPALSVQPPIPRSGRLKRMEQWISESAAILVDIKNELAGIKKKLETFSTGVVTLPSEPRWTDQAVIPQLKSPILTPGALELANNWLNGNHHVLHKIDVDNDYRPAIFITTLAEWVSLQRLAVANVQYLLELVNTYRSERGPIGPVAQALDECEAFFKSLLLQ